MGTQAAALVVREKINAAIQDMPEVEEIKQLLAGSCKYILSWEKMGWVGRKVVLIACCQRCSQREGISAHRLLPL